MLTELEIDQQTFNNEMTAVFVEVWSDLLCCDRDTPRKLDDPLTSLPLSEMTFSFFETMVDSAYLPEYVIETVERGETEYVQRYSEAQAWKRVGVADPVEAIQSRWNDKLKELIESREQRKEMLIADRKIMYEKAVAQDWDARLVLLQNDPIFSPETRETFMQECEQMILYSGVHPLIEQYLSWYDATRLAQLKETAQIAQRRIEEDITAEKQRYDQHLYRLQLAMDRAAYYPTE